MTIEEMEYAVEAILFSMGDAVDVGDLAKALDMDKPSCRKAMKKVVENYNQAKRGLYILELENAYQLTSRKEYYEMLIRVVNQPKKHTLTDVVLETLSIVAYKQPITRQEIEAIRGVKSDHAVNRLIEYNFIEEVGRLDAPGRPILFGTTQEFLRTFGVSSIEDLPVINPTLVADLKQEAEEEIKVSLGI
ncbi:MAG: SMC-Scp complex subunit ScpB [Lachnospiraceae bacterium]